jgi:hypothetical protein
MLMLFQASSFNSVAGSSDGNGNLEAWHDYIHLTVGGTGHMSAIDFAAFDPIFWLHHCNVSIFNITLPQLASSLTNLSKVDRILTLWQSKCIVIFS